jgi:hypothetical protein
MCGGGPARRGVVTTLTAPPPHLRGRSRASRRALTGAPPSTSPAEAVAVAPAARCAASAGLVGGPSYSPCFLAADGRQVPAGQPLGRRQVLPRWERTARDPDSVILRGLLSSSVRVGGTRPLASIVDTSTLFLGGGGRRPTTLVSALTRRVFAPSVLAAPNLEPGHRRLPGCLSVGVGGTSSLVVRSARFGFSLRGGGRLTSGGKDWSSAPVFSPWGWPARQRVADRRQCRCCLSARVGGTTRSLRSRASVQLSLGAGGRRPARRWGPCALPRWGCGADQAGGRSFGGRRFLGERALPEATANIERDETLVIVGPRACVLPEAIATEKLADLRCLRRRGRRNSATAVEGCGEVRPASVGAARPGTRSPRATTGLGGARHR